VDAVSGATLSTRATCAAVRRCLALDSVLLEAVQVQREHAATATDTRHPVSDALGNDTP